MHPVLFHFLHALIIPSPFSMSMFLHTAASLTPFAIIIIARVVFSLVFPSSNIEMQEQQIHWLSFAPLLHC
ncbi:hypothetical protein QBC41DRAFT_330771 [Cercophora samala]|uniref:Uncharacterized protein n=1 Tax=Cercophora samala TaxID=330535 RepID=A0AA40D3U7_9PEZI|nr:hypothetical protein QBC41DRAFT_330771 [Cercophora samala]